MPGREREGHRGRRRGTDPGSAAPGRRAPPPAPRPTRPATSRQTKKSFPWKNSVADDRRADGRDRQLTEADLPGPAGEDHEGQHQHPEEQPDAQREDVAWLHPQRVRPRAARRAAASTPEHLRHADLDQARAAPSGSGAPRGAPARSRRPGPGPAPRRRAAGRSSATMITPNRTPSTTTRAAGLEEAPPARARPAPSAAANVTGRLSIRPITAAASARSSSDKPEASRRWPRPGSACAAGRARPESPAASTHTSVLSRCTGMPSSEARSADSALARTAMPNAAAAEEHRQPDARRRARRCDEDVATA